jgi:nitroreductase
MESKSVWNVKEKDFPRKGEMTKKLKFLVRYAILAPSGHNSQPWRFIIDKNKIEIWPDYERRRAIVDPEDRELYISLGCATKNIEVAADYFGLVYEKSYKIDNKKAVGVIVLHFKEGKKLSVNEKLFKAILSRQTNRGEYQIKQMAEKLEFEDNDDAKVKIFNGKEDRKEISKLIYSSNKVWFKTKELVSELDYWLQDDVNNGSNGVPTGALNLYKIAANLKYFLQKDSDGAVKKAEREQKMATEAPYLAVVETKMDGIENWIKAGEVYEHLALKLTSFGLAHSFFNTVIELKTQREKLANVLKLKGRPQMFLRIGYAKEEFPHSVRRPIEEVII